MSIALRLGLFFLHVGAMCCVAAEIFVLKGGRCREEACASVHVCVGGGGHGLTQGRHIMFGGRGTFQTC